MKPNRPGLAIASGICALPCAAQAIWALWLWFFVARNRTVTEDLMTLSLYAVYLCPVALVSVLLGTLARGWALPPLGINLLPDLAYFASG